MCANTKGFGETTQRRRLARAFTDLLCDMYHNLMSWLNCVCLLVGKNCTLGHVLLLVNAAFSDIIPCMQGLIHRIAEQEILS